MLLHKTSLRTYEEINNSKAMIMKKQPVYEITSPHEDTVYVEATQNKPQRH